MFSQFRILFLVSGHGLSPQELVIARFPRRVAKEIESITRGEEDCRPILIKNSNENFVHSRRDKPAQIDYLGPLPSCCFGFDWRDAFAIDIHFRNPQGTNSKYCR